MDLQRTEEQQVARYLSGLTPPIQDALCMYPIWSISEAYNRTLIIEKQLTKKALQSQPFGSTRNQVTPSSKPGQQTWPSKDTTVVPTVARISSSNKPNITVKCYKCGEQDHKANECKKPPIQARNKALLTEEFSHEDEPDQELPYEQEELELGNDFEGEEGLVLVTRKTPLSPKVEEDSEWLRGNIFYTTCTIKDRVCNLVIDGGSCENVVSQEVVEKLGFQTIDPPNIYKLSWLKKGNSVKVDKRCLISFSIRKQFHDEVLTL